MTVFCSRFLCVLTVCLQMSLFAVCWIKYLMKFFSKNKMIYKYCRSNLSTAIGGSLEFSRNTQSWQWWQLCTISNANKLETVNNLISFKANLHHSIVLWKIIEVVDFSSVLICKFRQHKVVNIASFVYYGKTQLLERESLKLIMFTRFHTIILCSAQSATTA